MRRFWVLLVVVAGVACRTSPPDGGNAQTIVAPPPVEMSEDERAIRDVLASVEQVMEQEDLYGVLRHVSASYHDSEGRGYADLKAFLQTAFSRRQKIDVVRQDTSVKVFGDRAIASESFSTYCELDDLPSRVSGRMSIHLEKVAGRWLITEWGLLQQEE